MKSIDRERKEYKESAALKFLYDTGPGRVALTVLSKPFISKLAGKILDSRISTVLIPGFIRHNGIDMNEYQKENYRSFNDFFTRHIRPEVRPVDHEPGHLIAPCDGMLSVYRIAGDTPLPVKHSLYTAGELLRNDTLAAEFENGLCLVFRLGPHNYHRYCFPEAGIPGSEHSIKGVLHTVRPIAAKHYRVYTENAREYMILETERFGQLIQMEVGAMLVGRIDNYPVHGPVKRGQEKGRFLFGGSTILLLVKDGILDLEECHEETAVKQGVMVARSESTRQIK